MGRKSKYPPEVRERAVRLAREQFSEYDSEWGAISSVAAKFGCSAETLRKWIRDAEAEAGKRAAGGKDQSERITELEREVRELRRANEILRKASAYFAQAELDRRQK